MAEHAQRARRVLSNQWLRLAFGVVTTALGLIVIFWPGHPVAVVSILFAAQLIVGAVFRFVFAFSAPPAHEWLRTAYVVVGVISLIGGVLLLRYPGSLASETFSLVLVLGIYWIISGLVDLFVTVAETRAPRRGVTAVTGFLSLVAGVIILAVPVAPIALIAWVLGGFLIVLGVITVVQALLLLRTSGQATKSPAAS